MKKLLNFLYVLLAIIGGALLSVKLIFWLVLPLGPVQRQLQKSLTALSGQTIAFEHLSAGFTFLELSDVRVAASCGGTSAPDVFRARRVTVRWVPLQVLTGHIKIKEVLAEEPQVHVVACAEDSAQPDTAPAAADTSDAQSQKPSFWLSRLQVEHVRLTHGRVQYEDPAVSRRAGAEDVFFEVRHFDLEKPFPLSINAQLTYEDPTLSKQVLELGLTVWPELKNLDFTQAAVELTRVVIRHIGGVFELTGRVNQLAAPQADLRLAAQEMNEGLITPFSAQAPAFEVDEMTADVSGWVEVEGQTVHISSFTVAALDSSLSVSGQVNLARPENAALSGNFSLNLQSVANALLLLRPYRLTGSLTGQAVYGDQLVSAQARLAHAGAHLPGAGTLEDINMGITLKDSQTLQIPDLTGYINEGKFESTLFAKKTDKAINADLYFSAPRIALPPMKEQEEAPDEPENTTAIPAVQDSPQPADSGLPFNLSAEVNIGSLDAPFIWGKNIRFTTSLRHFTPDMAGVRGELAFSSGEGEIKDLDKLLHSNMLADVLFGSLDVVSRVINSLDVISLLDGLADAAVGGGKEESTDLVVKTVQDDQGRDVQILVPYAPEQAGSRWAFEQFATDVVFSDGLADMKKGSFVSDLLSFNVLGTMNFKSRALDMTVHAAPGHHYTDGIMPLTIDIGGTIEQPQGSLQVASSVVNMVTQGVTNNFVSRTVKKFFGLFKKKTPAPAEEGPVLTTQAAARAREERSAAAE